MNLKNNILANIGLYLNEEYEAISIYAGKLTIISNEPDILILSYNLSHLIHNLNRILGSNYITRISIIKHVT